MTVKKPIAVLLAATTLVFACKEDPIAPDTTGTISLNITINTEAPPSPASRSVGEIDPVSKEDAASRTGAISLIGEGPGPVDSTEVAAMAAEASASAYMPPTVDAIDVAISGPTNTTATLTPDGNGNMTGTIGNLTPGSYSIALVGSENGLVTYLGLINGVTVNPGEDTAANGTLNVFVPVLDPFTSPTPITSFAAVFSEPQTATEYLIEFDSDSTFPNPGSITSTSSPAALVANLPGTFYLRVRASNPAIAANQAAPSNVEAITIVPDTTAGDDQGSALPVGTGILDSLNILPAGDQDWFSLNLTAGDALSVWTYAQVLNPPSALDTELWLFNAAGDTLAYNDDDGNSLDSWLDAIPIAADGQYFVVVSGLDSTVGYYEIEIDIGSGIDSVAVTPTVDTVAVAGNITQLTATAYDQGGNAFMGVAFTWSSNDSSVAIPDSTGLVQTFSDGTAIITATAPNGLSASATVEVLLPPVASITTADNAFEYALAGQTQTIAPTALDSMGNPVGGVTFSYRSLNDNVVTVNSNGDVTSAGAGQSAVEVSVGNVKAYVTTTVEAGDPTPLNLIADDGAPAGTDRMFSIWGTASDDVYAVGESGTITMYDGASWSAMTSGTSEDLFGVWGIDGMVYAVGANETIVAFDGTSWDSSYAGGTALAFRSIWGSAPNDIFAVGDGGAIAHFDGSNWSVQNVGSNDLFDVYGFANDNVFAVGAAGTILRYDGTNWNSMSVPSTAAPIRGVFGFTPDEVFAVGGNETLWNWDGTSWNVMTGTGSGAVLRTVWGTGGSDLYAAGTGAILWWDGGAWNNIGDPGTIDDIFGTPNPSVFVGAANGFVGRAYRGASFSVSAALDTLVSFNDTVTVAVQATDSSGNNIAGVPVTYTSSADSIATVDSAGTVTAVNEGSADITVMSMTAVDSVALVVYQTVASVTIDQGDTVLVAPAAMDTLTATPLDANGNNIQGRTSTWMVGDTAVAIIDSVVGEASGVRTGKTTLTATVDGVAGNSTLIVPIQSNYGRTFGSGEQHHCALDSSGNAYCWGRAQDGNLGDGSGIPQSSPVMVQGGMTFTQLTVGGAHNCGLTAAGEIYCWGRGWDGQLGDGSTNSSDTPVKVFGSQRWHEVNAGDRHTCAVTIAGEPYCWGDGRFGKRGDGTTGDISIPVPVSGGMTFETISAGYYHSCAVDPAGDGYCWGRNEQNALGDGAGGSGIESHTPVAVSAGATSFMMIRAGLEYSCGLDTSGAAWCWGDGGSGQLGDNTYQDRATPVAVAGGFTFQDIAATFRTTCAVTTTNSGHCWGANNYGMHGDSTYSYWPQPQPGGVYGGLSLNYVVPGYYSTCGRDTGTTLYCWGRNNNGQAGTGLTIPITPQPVGGGLNFTSIGTGYYHTCGLDSVGEGYCWGNGGGGAIGDGSTSRDSLPSKVAGGLFYTKLSVGAWHNCALSTTNAVWCWGEGYYGNLGNGTFNTTSSVIQAVTGATNYIDVDAGHYFNCGIDNTNAAYCWGRNNYGQLGDTALAVGDSASTPRPVAGGIAFSQISAGYEHACGLDASGNAYCWGRGTNGQLGDSASANSVQPVAVAGGIQFSTITTGRFHTCGIDMSGNGYCWGSSSYTGNNQSSNYPVMIAGSLLWSQIRADWNQNTCGTTTGGQPHCWGPNYEGQIGDGTFNWAYQPQAVSTGLTATETVAGFYHACMVDTSSQAHCWGWNEQMQLGLGSAGGDVIIPNAVIGGITYLVPPFVGARREE